jgi:DNA invertase Pin-like site-specific DNA recombinase
MKIGYIRCSSEGQNTARQEVLMQELGVDEVFIDKLSGKNTDRPQLKKMLSYVRKGDTVIVSGTLQLRMGLPVVLDNVN